MCKLFLKDIIKTNFESKKNIVRNSFPKEVGQDSMILEKIQDDFFFLKTAYTFNQKTQIEAKQNEKKFVITLGLEGHSSYKSINKEDIHFKKGYTTISLFNHTEGIREFYSNKVNQVRLILNESFLIRNLGEKYIQKYLKEEKELKLLDFSPTNISSQIILNQILNNKYNGDLSSIFLQSKTLELLYLEFNKLENRDNNNKISLDNYDINAIYQAKEILIDNIQNPPSIIELAKKVHLNEFKLKKGFKQIFNTTPYKLLNKYKMNIAKELLQEGIYNINEVSEMVGYKYANNFTNAFYKEFKVIPKSILKEKKIFY